MQFLSELLFSLDRWNQCGRSLSEAKPTSCLYILRRIEHNVAHGDIQVELRKCALGQRSLDRIAGADAGHQDPSWERQCGMKRNRSCCVDLLLAGIRVT